MSGLLIKELRKRTGAGFLDCKKALDFSKRDIEKAIEWLKIKGSAIADKKAGAIAADGVVSIKFKNKKYVIYEVNSQTDFVASNEQFLNLVDEIGEILLKNSFSTLEEANKLKNKNGKSIEELCVEATAKLGEKIVLRRVNFILLKDSQNIGWYVHVNNKIAALLVSEGGSSEVLRNVCMHIASMNPKFLNKDAISQVELQKMKKNIEKSEVLKNKPEKIRKNIAYGMLKKQLSAITLLDQEFVMEKMLVSKYLSNNSAKAVKMMRFEVGEGIEKVKQDFVSEVKAQMSK